MKRLLILSMLTMVVASTAGCGWWRPYWRRGSSCDPCATSGPYDMGYNGGGYEMAYPPATSHAPNLLPGPVQVVPPG